MSNICASEQKYNTKLMHRSHPLVWCSLNPGSDHQFSLLAATHFLVKKSHEFSDRSEPPTST